jgi:hypothetical protein
LIANRTHRGGGAETLRPSTLQAPARRLSDQRSGLRRLDDATQVRAGCGPVAGARSVGVGALKASVAPGPTPVKAAAALKVAGGGEHERYRGAIIGASNWDQEHLIPDPKPLLPPRVHDADARGSCARDRSVVAGD